MSKRRTAGVAILAFVLVIGVAAGAIIRSSKESGETSLSATKGTPDGVEQGVAPVSDYKPAPSYSSPDAAAAHLSADLAAVVAEVGAGRQSATDALSDACRLTDEVLRGNIGVPANAGAEYYDAQLKILGVKAPALQAIGRQSTDPRIREYGDLAVEALRLSREAGYVTAANAPKWMAELGARMTELERELGVSCG